MAIASSDPSSRPAAATSLTDDPNFMTGHRGLLAIDKIGNKVLFLDPVTCETLSSLDNFIPRVHELAISPARSLAFIPIYGDGKHGANPHPGHLIAVVDLHTRQHVRDINTAPYLAPHGLRWGPQGQLYCLCEDAGVVLDINADSGDVRHVIAVGSDKAHRMEILPDGSKLYTENEEDSFVSVIDLNARQRVATIPAPSGLVGIGLSPDGHTLVLVDATHPRVLVVDTATDEVVRTVELRGHRQAAQIARFSPNGRYLVVTSHDEPLATVFNADLTSQRMLKLGKGPMNMAFHEDGHTALIADHDEGTLAVVDLKTATVTRIIACGKGVETLSFY